MSLARALSTLLLASGLGAAAQAGSVARPAASLAVPAGALACPGCGLGRFVLDGSPLQAGLSLQAQPGLTLAPAFAQAPEVSVSLPAALPGLQPQPSPVSATPAPEAGAYGTGSPVGAGRTDFLAAGAQTLTAVERGAALIGSARDESGRQGALQELFERFAARDGAAVYPQLLTPETLLAHDRQLASAKADLARAVAAVQPALERSVWCGGWRGPQTTLHDSCCGDAAPKLGLLLRETGRAVDAVEAEFHFYLIYRLPFGEIVVDPTIRQFFGGARAPPDIPKVFVGTVANLNDLFRRHAAAKTTSYGVDRIYFRDARVRNAKIDELRRLAQDHTGAPEYQPLARTVPPAALPPAPGLVLSAR